MKPIQHKALLILFMSLFTAVTAFSQQVQTGRKYRVVAYKNGSPEITSTSNTVEVIPYMSIYIPNSFTPNGDGMNDLFGVYGEAIREFNMQIYNRWGQMIFEANDYNTRWDGTYEGVRVPQGSYVYKYTAKGITGSTSRKDGTVTVIY